MHWNCILVNKWFVKDGPKTDDFFCKSPKTGDFHENQIARSAMLQIRSHFYKSTEGCGFPVVLFEFLPKVCRFTAGADCP